MNGQAGFTLGKVLSLQRMGNLTAAETACRKLLAASPENPFLLGKLAALVLRQGRAAQARILLKRAVAAGGEARIQFCNLRAYLALLGRSGKEQEARRVAQRRVPDWPTGVTPDSAMRGVLMALMRSLIALDEAKTGLRVLCQAFPDRSEDAELLGFEGRLRAAAGDPEAGVRLLRRAVELSPQDPALPIALGGTQARIGRHDDARQTTGLLVRRFPYFAKTRRDGQTATILILNPAPMEILDPRATLEGAHFWVNYPSEFSRRMERRYRFLSLFETVGDDSRPWESDAPSIILNNLVNENDMTSPGALVRVRALVDRIGTPVINSPEAVARVSRTSNAEALTGIPGLKVPRTARYRVEQGSMNRVVREIGDTIGYPAILRHPSTHSTADSLLGKTPRTVFRVSNSAEAREALLETNWAEFFATEFVDLRKKEGWYRKLRAVCVGDEIIVFRGGCYSEWAVSGWFTKPEGIAFYRAHPEALENLRAVLNDPVSELGPACLSVLRRICERIPLDIFGIDFDVDDTGQVVFFEGTAGMIFLDQRHRVPRDLWLPGEPLERIDDAFHRLVGTMCAGNAARSATRIA